MVAESSSDRAARPLTRAHDIASELLFFVGAALCLTFLHSPTQSWGLVIVAAAVLTGIHRAARMSADRAATGAAPGRRWGPRRMARLAARVVVLCFYAGALCFALVAGQALAWCTPWWGRALVIALLATAAFSRVLGTRSPRLSLAVPVGLWINLCLFGWGHEEARLRCDDWLRLRPPVSLIAPTTLEAERCRPGAVVPIGRYPRKTWQSPDGERVWFTTQHGPGRRRPGRFDGLVCEVPVRREAGRDVTPVCVGGTREKAHGLAEAAGIGKVFAAAYYKEDGRGRGVILTLPREGPLRLEAEHRVDGPILDVVYEPRSRLIRGFVDSADRVRTFSLPDFQPLPDIHALLVANEVHYDADRDEGLLCGWPIGVAFRANPFAYRYLGGQAGSTWGRLAVSWGCDWDRATRTVYAAAPALGLYFVLDYDTGRIREKHFVGFGMRSVAFDQRRRRLYFANFLRGEVVAVDVATGAVTSRWFVGRFAREVRLSRDGGSLLATSNLGVLAIDLGPADPSGS
jgi:hypothetical protein